MNFHVLVGFIHENLSLISLTYLFIFISMSKLNLTFKSNLFNVMVVLSLQTIVLPHFFVHMVSYNELLVLIHQIRMALLKESIAILLKLVLPLCFILICLYIYGLTLFPRLVISSITFHHQFLMVSLLMKLYILTLLLIPCFVHLVASVFLFFVITCLINYLLGPYLVFSLAIVTFTKVFVAWIRKLIGYTFLVMFNFLKTIFLMLPLLPLFFF